MAIQDPLTGLIFGCCYRIANELGNGATRLGTCLLVNFGKARIQVRRLGMSRGASAGEVESGAKDVQSSASGKWRGMFAGDGRG